MKKTVYFENKFNKIKSIDPIDLNQLDHDIFYKTASKKAVQNIKQLNSVFNEIFPHIENNHKFTSFDVKLKNIKKNQIPSIGGWHCDGNIVNPLHQSTPDRFMILVSGKECLTQFISEPIELEFDDSLSIQEQMKNFQLQIKKINPKKEFIEPWSLIEYSRFSFHTATRSLGDHRRLLIRVNESDLLIPVAQKIKVLNLGVFPNLLFQ